MTNVRLLQRLDACAGMGNLRLFVPCSLAFFDLLISVGQRGLTIVSLNFQNGQSEREFSYAKQNRFKSGLKSSNIEKQTLSGKNDVCLDLQIPKYIPFQQ